MKSVRSLSINDVIIRSKAKLKLVIGVVMLAISVPVFILYHDFPSLNSQIGPHQIASWIAVTLSFFGFILVIMGAGELDV